MVSASVFPELTQLMGIFQVFCLFLLPCSSHQVCEVGAVITPILRIKKLRLQDFKQVKGAQLECSVIPVILP